jgi:hypothetical protein
MRAPKPKKNVVAFSGLYFVLFFSSIKVLLHKRKTIAGTTPLLALAGVFGVLITWVSVSRANDTLLSGDGSHSAIFSHPFPDSTSSQTGSEQSTLSSKTSYPWVLTSTTPTSLRR